MKSPLTVCPPEVTLHDAYQLMRARTIGSLVALLSPPVAGLVDELVEVSLLKAMSLEEADIVGLQDEVEPLNQARIKHPFHH